MRPSCSALWSRFRPMKTNRHSRVSFSFHNPMSSLKSPPKSMCTPWKTNFWSIPLTARTPLYRNRSSPLSRINSPIHLSSLLTLSSPSNLALVEVTRWSCSCSASVSKNSGSISNVLSKSNEPMLINSFGSIKLFCVLNIGAKLLIDLILDSTSCSCSSSTKSILFSIILSAKAICSTDSFSTSSGFSSSKC